LENINHGTPFNLLFTLGTQSPAAEGFTHMAQNIAQIKRAVKNKPYNPKLFVAFLASLMEKKNVSMREVSIDAGLHHQAAHRFKKGMRPPCLIAFF
jgi:hypothetical protein